MSRALSIIVAVLFLGVAGFGSCGTATAAEEEATTAGRSSAPLAGDEYKVSPQDQLQIAIVGEDDLPTNFEVNEKDGTINYPFIEYVKVAGLTVTQIEKLLTVLLRGANPAEADELRLDFLRKASREQIEKRTTELFRNVGASDGWYVNPGVNVIVAKYSEKYFYVEGYVNKPGKYSFTGQNIMTVYRAIIMAGGFKPTAKKGKVIVITTDEKGKEKNVEVDISDVIKGRPDLDPPIKANDIIHVPESFW